MQRSELGGTTIAEISILFEASLTPATARAGEAAVDKTLMEAGLMTVPPQGLDPDAYHAFQPVTIQGEALSTTILKERR